MADGERWKIEIAAMVAADSDDGWQRTAMTSDAIGGDGCGTCGSRQLARNPKINLTVVPKQTDPKPETKNHA